MRPRRAVAALLGLLAFVLALTLSGCTPTVSLHPGPAATATQCAALIVRLPATLGSAAKRETDAQGTAAWGDPQSVVLRCGVDRVPAAYCQTINGVDWTVRALPGGGQNPRYVLTTYGRNPATEVVVDTARIHSSDAMPPISTAVADAVKATAHCADTGRSSPSPSATP